MPDRVTVELVDANVASFTFRGFVLGCSQATGQGSSKGKPDSGSIFRCTACGMCSRPFPPSGGTSPQRNSSLLDEPLAHSFFRHG